MTTTSIPALLEPIQERLSAPLFLPWTHEPWGGQNQNGDYAGGYVLDETGEYVVSDVGDTAGAFIAHAPTDTARLLAAVKAVTDLADAWQARGDHLLKYAAENRFPDGVAESLSESGAEFVHSAKLVRSAVEAALRGEA